MEEEQNQFSNSQDIFQIKYLDLVQQDIKLFNINQQTKLQEIRQQYGEKTLNDIINSKQHHERKAIRSVNYALNQQDLSKLQQTGIVFKQMNNQTFCKQYLELYNNDMPVIITSDSMLFALHKFWDQFLEFIELEEKIKQLNNLIINLLTIFYDTNFSKQLQSQEDNDYLKYIEVLFIIPHLILSVKQNKREKKNNEFIKKFKDKNKIIEQLKAIKFPLKYVNQNDIVEIMQRISEYQDFQIKFNKKIIIEMNGTTLKPRGHYTKEVILEQYFLAFTWLCKFCININQKDENNLYKLKFIVLVCQISSQHIAQIQEFEHFIETIIGFPDGYTFSSFYKLIQSDIQQFYQNPQNIQITQANQMSKFGDDDIQQSQYSFSIIGKGNSIDNIIISNLVYPKIKNDSGEIIDRKYASPQDLAYVLFKNEEIREIVYQRTQNLKTNIKYRDGFQIMKQYDFLNKQNFNYSNTILDQELRLLTALSFNNSAHIKPFNTKLWLKKQAQTQLAHYAEIRHDNVLYQDEVSVPRSSCKIPDIIIEPNLVFWQEFLKTIKLYQSLLSGQYLKKSPFSTILQNFEKIILIFIEYLSYYINDKPIPQNIFDILTEIIDEHKQESGGPNYSGWYPQLFYDTKECVNFSPEISTMLTSQPDNKDQGGIVHLGTGSVQLGYFLVEQPNQLKKLFLGPVYSFYEMITDYNKRYNDKEWSQDLHKQQQFNYI